MEKSWPYAIDLISFIYYLFYTEYKLQNWCLPFPIRSITHNAKRHKEDASGLSQKKITLFLMLIPSLLFP